MARVVTFGEIMMRLNPPQYRRLIQTDSLEMSFAGGEANVAVSLAQFGEETAFVSKLPPNNLGRSAINSLRRYGVETQYIPMGDGRLGIYFVEKGASQRPSTVTYDRKDSVFALSSLADYDWDRIFEGAEWFHFTGITPALGGELPAVCKQACKMARKKGLIVSCDLNYRKKLWSRDEARNVMSELMPYVNLCIANEEDAYDVFEIQAEHSDIDGGKINRDGYIEVARRITERFGCDKVAITLRGSVSATINRWSAVLYCDGLAFYAPEYVIQIVDRVGGGDSFAGGLIFALINGYAPQKAVEFATAASCLKHTIEHDFNLVTVPEVELLAEGNASGRVQR